MKLSKNLLFIRVIVLTSMFFTLLGYLSITAGMPPLRSFGLTQYFERASLYGDYLKIAFVFLTPLSLLMAGFLLTFSGFGRVTENALAWALKLPAWFFWGLIPLLFTAASAITAHQMIGSVPRVFDAFNYHFQAQNLALFQFFAPAPPLSELFKFPFIIIDQGKWYGSVYPGFSILLAFGLRLGADWLVNPILGGIALMLVYFAAREMIGEKSARLTSFLGLISPFFRVMSSIFMSHVAGIVWVTLAMWMLWRWSQRLSNTSVWTCFWAGTAMAWIYITRPQAGMVTLPFLLLYTINKVRWCGFKRLAAVILPVVCSILFLGIYNHQLTGDYSVNPRYYVDPERRLGFGDDLGEPLADGSRSGHSLARGLNNSALLISLWNAEMFGWGSWGVFGWLTLVIFCGLVLRWKDPLVWILGSSILMNAGLYVFYFTPSPNFGPRYFAEVIPASLILFVIGFRSLISKLPLWTRHNSSPVAAVYLIASLSMVGIFVMFPLHWQHYGVLPQKMIKQSIEIPDDSCIIMIPELMYTMNIYLWNSPNLNGNIFLPLKASTDLRKIRETFSDRNVFILGQSKISGKSYVATDFEGQHVKR